MLTITDLHVQFRSRSHEAVKGISLQLADGEILGLVGESGSGKTVTALTVSGLLNRRQAQCRGSVLLDGQELLDCTERDWLSLRGNRIGVVFQEPMTALNPLLKIGVQVEEGLRVHSALSPQERRKRALEALAAVDLREPERVYRSYPHELSGGMLQRVCIAAAIVTQPSLLIADEPTTALDVTVQRQILQLLRRINRETGTSILFISHNLAVVRRLCDRVAVMEKGRIVEEGTAEQIFEAPQADYTRMLIEAIPRRNERRSGA